MQPGAVVTITNSPKLNGSWVIRLQGLFSDSTYLLNKPFVETTEEEKDAAFWTGTGIVDLAVESKEASGLNVESNIITSAALSSSWNGTSMKFNNTALWNTDYGNVLRKES